MQLLQDDLETILIGQWKLEEKFHQIGRTLALLFLRRPRPSLLPTHPPPPPPPPLRHRPDCSTIDECCDVKKRERERESSMENKQKINKLNI